MVAQPFPFVREVMGAIWAGLGFQEIAIVAIAWLGRILKAHFKILEVTQRISDLVIKSIQYRYIAKKISWQTLKRPYLVQGNEEWECAWIT